MAERCSECAQHFDTLDQDVINDVQTLEIEISHLAEKIGKLIGPKMFVMNKSNSPDGEFESASLEDIPPQMLLFNNFAALNYAVAFLTAQHSPNSSMDQMIGYIISNAINDGNAVYCGNRAGDRSFH